MLWTLALALAMPLPQLPAGEAVEAWREAWQHTGLADRVDLGASVHLVAAPGPERWTLQVRERGEVLRAVTVSRPTNAVEREEIAFLAAGLLRELDQAAALASAPAPRPVFPDAPPPRPTPAPKAPAPPRGPTPAERLASGLEAPISGLLLPAPRGLAQRVAPAELPPDDLDLGSNEVVELDEPAPRDVRGPPPRFQLAPLSMGVGTALRPSDQQAALRLGLQVPLHRGDVASYVLDVGLLPAHRIDDADTFSASSWQGEVRLGVRWDVPWWFVEVDGGVAARAYTQSGLAVQTVMVPHLSTTSGPRLGPVRLGFGITADAVRADLRYPDQSLREGSFSQYRAELSFDFGRVRDPFRKVATSPVRDEETP